MQANGLIRDIFLSANEKQMCRMRFVISDLNDSSEFQLNGRQELVNMKSG